MMDISIALTNPRSIAKFSVVRQVESLGVNGRASVAPKTYPLVYGTVMAGQDNNLVQEDADTRTSKTLSIVTRFRLQATSPGREADIVIWPIKNGDRFKVIRVDDYSQYASGFVQAVAISINAQDQPPSAALVKV